MFRPRAVFFIAAVLIALCLTQAVPAFAADIPFAEFIPASSCKIDGGCRACRCGRIDKRKVISPLCRQCRRRRFILTDIPAEGITLLGARGYPSLSNNPMHYSVDGGDGLVWTSGRGRRRSRYNKWSYMYSDLPRDGDFRYRVYGY